MTGGTDRNAINLYTDQTLLREIEAVIIFF